MQPTLGKLKVVRSDSTALFQLDKLDYKLDKTEVNSKKSYHYSFSLYERFLSDTLYYISQSMPHNTLGQLGRQQTYCPTVELTQNHTSLCQQDRIFRTNKVQQVFELITDCDEASGEGLHKLSGQQVPSTNVT